MKAPFEMFTSYMKCMVIKLIFPFDMMGVRFYISTVSM